MFKEGPFAEISNYRPSLFYLLFLDYLKNLCTTNYIGIWTQSSSCANISPVFALYTLLSHVF